MEMAGGFSMAPLFRRISASKSWPWKRRNVVLWRRRRAFAVLKGESQQWMGCTPQKISISQKKKEMVERCSFQDAGCFVGGVRFLV